MKTNPLGDLRAESDHEMLDRVFYETPDYRSLLEEHTRRVVVGRRGTGKSAAFYKLQRYWESAAKTTTIVLTPSETDMIGLRPIVSLFGTKYSYLRAACTLAWQFAVLQEILSELTDHYKVRADSEMRNLTESVKAWRRGGDNITSRLFKVLSAKVDKRAPEGVRVATLAQALGINDLMIFVEKAMSLSKTSLYVIADRLDEGYEPDVSGVAILSGLIYAFDKLSSGLPNTATTVFFRDNIFRAIQM